MKKVLILVNHDIVIYNFRKELVERLLSEGYEVHISSPYGERIDFLINMGCKYINTSINRHGTNVVEDLKLIMNYKKIMRKVQPNIVLSYTIKPNIYGGIAAKSLNIPYVANITGLGTAVEKKSIMQFVTVKLYQYAFRKIKCIFFQNKENMLFFNNHKIALGNHRLLPGSGVNLKQFVVLEYPQDDTVEFVFISRIMKEKGIEQYLEAAIYIKEKYPYTVFHICGFCEEDYEKRLNDLQEQGIILYHGMIKDITRILQVTHCTIHPSYYPEGMSNVLLESAASGRPIISTNRSGCRETIDDGVNGFIVNSKDTQDLISKIESFIELSYSDKKKMGLEGRRKMEKEFNRDIVVQSYLNEIQK